MEREKILDKLKLREATLLKINNIKVFDNYILFENNDPQIIIRFKRKIKSLKLRITLTKPLKTKTNIAMYYSNNSNFNVHDVITCNVKIYNEFERYISFDKEIKYIRLDLSDENIKIHINSLCIEPSEYRKEDVILKNIRLNKNKLNTLCLIEDEQLYQNIIKVNNINFINIINKKDIDDFYDIQNRDNNKFDYIDIKDRSESNANFLFFINYFRKINIDSIVINDKISLDKLKALKDYGYNIILIKEKIDNSMSYLMDKIDWIITQNIYDQNIVNNNYKTKIIVADSEKTGEMLILCLRKGIQILPPLDLYMWGPYRKKHFLEMQNNKRNYINKSKDLYHAIIKSSLKKIKTNENAFVMLNTYIGSDNEGDNIIMTYCSNIMKDIVNNKQLINIPTHIYDNKIETIKTYKKILCGTNIIYKNMEENMLWTFPNDFTNLKNTILMGVGLQSKDIDKDMSSFSKKFFNYILCKDGYHSVRDEHTKQALEKIGISNVLNTGCPTMWNLTKEFCQTIPKTKSESVVTTITDYDKDEKNDLLMLNILKNNYKNVYIWIQGQYDYDYLKTIINLDDFILIPPSLEMLDRILINNDVDYVGTRLHAGIRSLNMKKRSLVISIDNRARDIGEDTNLPVLERKKIEYDLENWINSEYITQINIPEKNIELWKKQFKKQ